MDLKSNPQQIKSVRPDLNLKESYNLPVCFFLFFFVIVMLHLLFEIKY